VVKAKLRLFWKNILVEPIRHFNPAVVLLLISLLVSFVLNWFQFVRGRQYYLQLNETRLDPLGLSYYPSGTNNQQKFVDTDRITVVFFGDSRAADWSSPDLPQFEFINRGIGAQTSTQVLQRFDHHLKPLTPRVVIVQVGINDLKAIPLFPERKEAIIDSCKTNIRQIVQQSVDVGATVILTTIFPVGKIPPARRLFWSSDVASAVNEVNSYIYSLEAQNVIIFDAYSMLADSDGSTRDKYVNDFLHLNETGYAALNSELVHILAPLE